jgi:hypothetical protein
MQAVVDDLERVAISSLPLKRDPDIYQPRNSSGLEAAEALAAHFGKEPPPLTVRPDQF